MEAALGKVGSLARNTTSFSCQPALARTLLPLELRALMGIMLSWRMSV
jgi:hypothetical protein